MTVAVEKRENHYIRGVKLKKGDNIVLAGFLIFVLFAVSVNANTDYNETGNFDGLYQNGRGNFNDPVISAGLITYIQTSGITDIKKAPLVSDLDGDGVNEVIIISGDTIFLYNNKELNFVASLDIGDEQRYSNMITFDIDGDGYTEIMVALEETEFLQIAEYNGSDFYLQTSLNMSNFAMTKNEGATGGEIVIKCSGVERCFMAYPNFQISGVDLDVFASFFNSTFIGHEQKLEDASGGTHAICFPRARNVVAVDYDGDGEEEFIFSMLMVSTTSIDEEVKIYYVQMESNGSLSLDSNNGGIVTLTTPDNFIETDTTFVYCDNDIGTNEFDRLPQNYITNPILHDLSDNTNLETVIGYAEDEDDFLVSIIKADGNTLQVYPKTLDLFHTNINGNVISNIFIADANPDSQTQYTDEDDFCVQVFDIDENQINVACFSERTAVWTNGRYYQWDITDDYNVTIDDYDFHHSILTHATQHDEETDALGDEDLSEIINTYGIFTLGSCSPIANCDMERIYANDLGESALISIDAEKLGAEDLLGITASSIFYIDDQQTNNPAFITNREFNPCPINQIIAINNTIQITLVVTDTNPTSFGVQDNVNARVTIYEGDTNEQNQSILDHLSGVPMQFTFTFPPSALNKTVINGNILIEAWDNENPTEIDSQNVVLNVRGAGINFGDVSCDESFEVEAVETIITECEMDDDCSNNFFCINQICTARAETLPVRAMDEASTIFGMSVTILWLMFMFAWVIAVWFAPIGRMTGGALDFLDSATGRLGVIIIGEAIMLTLGTLFGFIHWIILLTIILFILIAGSLWVVRIFTRASG